VVDKIIAPKASMLCAHYQEALEQSFTQLYDYEDSNAILTAYSRVKYFQQVDSESRDLPFTDSREYDVKITRRLLASLPDTFSEMKVVINRSLGAKTFTEVVAQILDWVADALLEKPKVQSSHDVAMALRTRDTPRSRRSNAKAHSAASVFEEDDDHFAWHFEHESDTCHIQTDLLGASCTDKIPPLAPWYSNSSDEDWVRGGVSDQTGRGRVASYSKGRGNHSRAAAAFSNRVLAESRA
jgi:hypothetical protein